MNNAIALLLEQMGEDPSHYIKPDKSLSLERNQALVLKLCCRVHSVFKNFYDCGMESVKLRPKNSVVFLLKAKRFHNFLNELSLVIQKSQQALICFKCSRQLEQNQQLLGILAEQVDELRLSCNEFIRSRHHNKREFLVLLNRVNGLALL